MADESTRDDRTDDLVDDSVDDSADDASVEEASAEDAPVEDALIDDAPGGAPDDDALRDADALDEAADAEAEAAARKRAARRERKAKATEIDEAADAGRQGTGRQGKGTASDRPARSSKDVRSAAARARQEGRSRAQLEKHLRRSGNPAKRGSTIRKPLAPPTLGDWIGALRIRTLPMSIAPVAVGAAAAYNLEGFHLAIALLCLGVALFLQLGVNVANDYSDGVRGTDKDRVGPKRITTSTAVEPTTVRTVALVLLAIGAACGVALAIVSQQWWLLAVGAVCVLAAWFYTGGKRPYGYYALGELVVFVIFGPVAVLGTMYATLGRWSEDGLVVALAMGCFAAATMLVNNLRDIDSDRASGKHTIPTIIGRVASKVLYALLILAPYVVLGIYALAFAYGPFVLLTLLIAIPAIIVVAMGRTARDFVTALGLTSLTTLLYGLGLAVTFWAGVTGFAL